MIEIMHTQIRITIELWVLVFVLVCIPGFVLIGNAISRFLQANLLGTSKANDGRQNLNDAPLLTTYEPPQRLTEQQKAFRAGLCVLHINGFVRNRMDEWITSRWFNYLVAEDMDFDEWCQRMQRGMFDKKTMMRSTHNFGPVSLKHLETAIEQYLVQKNAQNLTGDDRQQEII